MRAFAAIAPSPVGRVLKTMKTCHACIFPPLLAHSLFTTGAGARPAASAFTADAGCSVDERRGDAWQLRTDAPAQANSSTANSALTIDFARSAGNGGALELASPTFNADAGIWYGLTFDVGAASDFELPAQLVRDDARLSQAAAQLTTPAVYPGQTVRGSNSTRHVHLLLHTPGTTGSGPAHVVINLGAAPDGSRITMLICPLARHAHLSAHLDQARLTRHSCPKWQPERLPATSQLLPLHDRRHTNAWLGYLAV